MHRVCSVEIDDVAVYINWYGCYLNSQCGRSARLAPRSVSRGLGVRPTIVGLVLRRQTFYPLTVCQQRRWHTIVGVRTLFVAAILLQDSRCVQLMPFEDG